MSDKQDEKVELGFAETFLLSGIAAGISKTGAAPIERVKLLVQNQNEMLKQGVLDKPYKGVFDCSTRVLKTEGVTSFWRGENSFKLYFLYFIPHVSWSRGDIPYTFNFSIGHP